jgi:hypothetical protein
MRFLALGLLLVLVPFTPGDAKTIKQNCKDQCSSSYHFCLNRSLTSQARKDCKVAQKMCKGGCGK